MPHSEHLCGHENVIDDEREGSCVCINCGLVLESQLFLPGFNEIKYEKKITDIKEIEKNEQIRELLHRINLPDFLSSQISRKCEGKSKKKNSILHVSNFKRKWVSYFDERSVCRIGFHKF